MTRAGLLILLAVLGAAPLALAEGGKGTPAKKPAEAKGSPPAPRSADKPKAAAPAKPRVYTFTGLEVEGKLKVPQILYFLNRVRLELDTTGQEKRSFMKELESSGDADGL